MRNLTPAPHRVVAACAAIGLALAACGGDDDAAPVPAPADEPAAAEPADDEPADDEPAEVAADETDEPGDGSSNDDASNDDPADQPGVGDGKPSVQVPDAIPTELVITDLVEGEGDAAQAGDTLSLHYVGVLTADGSQFDSSWDSGLPFDVALGSGMVIPGFDEGLMGVKVGGRRQIDIPSELAYGSQGAGGVIPPDAAITFVVDILSLDRPVPPTIPERADPSECPAPDGSSEQRREFDAYPPFCIDGEATYLAEVVTNFGSMTFQLNPAEAPLTVNNFVVLAQYHYFDGTECHRAIPGFVVQCGDPTATGGGSPGYRFADEPPTRPYEIGSLAMANSGPDTNGSQFFIITGDHGASLPQQYNLFGDVIGGLDTTVAALDAVANPDDNGIPPLEQIIIESVTITEQ